MARASPSPHNHPSDRLVGQSSALHALRLQLHHLATFDTLGNPHVPTVLLSGETGTGKGLIARILHDSGPRAAGPFVEVNCAAIPETLLEAELFGFEAGTFTDAKRAKPGLWEAASGGTLFLDEVAELPLPLQSKLLKVVEDKRVRRLGAVTERAVDVKLTAATQAELSLMVQAGRFRADLYHRLSVVLLTVPPLWQRREDILVLARHFLARYAAAHGLHPRRLSTAAEVWLQGYGWPGNVRELSHLMERVTLFSRETIVAPNTLEELCLPRLPSVNQRESGPGRDALEAGDERAHLEGALRHTGGNIVQAARLLGLSRAAMRYRMSRYGITHPRVATRPPSAALGDQADSLLAETLSLESIREPSPVSTPNWEQKPVAVLAIEITWPAVGVGDASPYESWTVASEWAQTILEKVRGFGGIFLQRSPSLLLAGFGVPHTLEQAPQRAVQTALALRRLGADAAEGGHPPELRFALHWGQVLVDSGAIDPTAHLLPIGDTLARPGRLLGYAEPGEILTSSEMGQLVGGWCELRTRETRRGIAPPDARGAHTVVRLRHLGSPLAMHRQRPLSRFMGRERELAILEDLLEQAREGRGQVVGIIGEPGVGKSRLCYEFARAHSSQGWQILEASADASGQATPYLPVSELLKSYFQIASRDAVATRRDKVTDTLRTLGPFVEPSLSALLTLLDVPVEDDAWQALDPSQRRQQLLEAIKRLLIRASQIQPLLLITENLHWIDGETQALFETLVGGLATTRILLLVTYRPEYHHGWENKTYYTQLRLDPLPRAHAIVLLDSLLGGDASLAPLTQTLWQRTAGNPFFLEESVQTLVDTQVLVGARGAYRLAKPVQNLQVPATVQAVLAARIDRLPPREKHLLQAAAVIGMEVPCALVQAVVELPEAELHQSLAHLQATEFLYETNLFLEITVTFKHALTHEVAYGSLPQQRQRALHARIVEAIEVLYPARLAEQVDRLAHHALRGEAWDKALAYCWKAGEKAMARSAHREAVGYFEQALDALSRVPEQRDTLEQAIDLRLALRSALYPAIDSKRILTALSEAESLAEALDDPRRLGQVSLFLSDHVRRIGAHDQAIATAQRALAFATAGGDAVLHALANQRLGLAYWAQGDYCRAIHCLEQSVAFFDGPRRHERFGQGFLPTVVSHAYLAKCHAELGTFAEGRAHGEEGLRIAEVVAHPSSLMLASWGVGLVALRQGDLPGVLPLLEQAVRLCQDADLPLYFPRTAAALSAAYSLSGRVADAVLQLTQAMEQTIATETAGFQTLCHLSMGEAQMLAGRLEDAHALAEDALALANRRQERGHQAKALWLLGDIAAQREPPEVERAEAHYRQALVLGNELGMRPLQAHCHHGLGTLYAKMSRREQARDELSTAIALYGAMEMTFWLPQAEATLAQIG